MLRVFVTLYFTALPGRPHYATEECGTETRNPSRLSYQYAGYTTRHSSTEELHSEVSKLNNNNNNKADGE